MSDAPTIAVALNAQQLIALTNALQRTSAEDQRYGGLIWSTPDLIATIDQLRDAERVLRDTAPHGRRSTLAAMAQTQAAHEYRNSLEIAGAPAPWQIAGEQLRSATGELPPASEAIAIHIMLAVNTAAGFRAIDTGDALTWERATR